MTTPSRKRCAAPPGILSATHQMSNNIRNYIGQYDAEQYARSLGRLEDDIT